MTPPRQHAPETLPLDHAERELRRSIAADIRAYAQSLRVDQSEGQQMCRVGLEAAALIVENRLIYARGNIG